MLVYMGDSLLSMCKSPPAAAQALMRRRRRRKQKMEMHGACKRPRNSMVRKVKTLKKLVPKGNSALGLDGLFRETADYILFLEAQVQVMQIMVNVLSGSNH